MKSKKLKRETDRECVGVRGGRGRERDCGGSPITRGGEIFMEADARVSWPPAISRRSQRRPRPTPIGRCPILAVSACLS